MELGAAGVKVRLEQVSCIKLTESRFCWSRNLEKCARCLKIQVELTCQQVEGRRWPRLWADGTIILARDQRRVIVNGFGMEFTATIPGQRVSGRCVGKTTTGRREYYQLVTWLGRYSREGWWSTSSKSEQTTSAERICKSNSSSDAGKLVERCDLCDLWKLQQFLFFNDLVLSEWEWVRRKRFQLSVDHQMCAPSPQELNHPSKSQQHGDGSRWSKWRKQANTDQNQIPWPVSVRAAGQSWNAGFCNGTILSLPVPVSVPTRPNNEMAEQHFKFSLSWSCGWFWLFQLYCSR